MKKILYTLLLSCIACSAAIAQNIYQPKEDTGLKGIVYNKEFTFDIRLHTHGMALAVNIGKLKTYYKTTYYHFELGELKHPKEYRFSRDIISQNNLTRTSGSYTYGKKNNFYVLRGGYGTKRYFSEKANTKGLALGISYEFGPSIGFLKPYYLDVYLSDSNTNQPHSIKYDLENAADFLNESSITGNSGFTKGLNEVKFYPGLHGKFGVHFDWGAFDEFVKAIEIGVMADFYLKTVPIMIDNVAQDLNTIPPTTVEILPENVGNRPFFINLYISLQLGKRW